MRINLASIHHTMCCAALLLSCAPILAAPDGERFLMIRESEDDAQESQINIVLNWFEELVERAPVP